MIKILIADDQELMRQSLKMILGGVEDFEVTDAVSNGTDVIRSIRENKPDVILMDVRMPKMDGVVCTKIIKENEPDIKIIILTTFDDDEYVFNAIKNGASGYLLKGVSFEELIEAIRKVHSGMAIMNDDITNKVLKLFSEMAKSKDSVEVDEQSINEIKENEWAIIEGIVEGLSNKEIATKLNFSEGTIRNNLSNILNKLGLKNRTQLAIWAVQSDAMSRMNNKNIRCSPLYYLLCQPLRIVILQDSLFINNLYIGILFLIFFNHAVYEFVLISVLLVPVTVRKNTHRQNIFLMKRN